MPNDATPQDNNNRTNAIGQMLSAFYVTDSSLPFSIDINWSKITPLRTLYERIAWVYEPRVPQRHVREEYVDWAGAPDQVRLTLLLVALYFHLRPDDASWFIGPKGTMLLDHKKVPGMVMMKDVRGDIHKIFIPSMLANDDWRVYTQYYDSLSHELTCIWEILDKVLWHYDEIPTDPPARRPDPPEIEPLDPEEYPQDE
jgi:hypothetical protein